MPDDAASSPRVSVERGDAERGRYDARPPRSAHRAAEGVGKELANGTGSTLVEAAERVKRE
jgi:hypothetical protein